MLLRPSAARRAATVHPGFGKGSALLFAVVLAAMMSSCAGQADAAEELREAVAKTIDGGSFHAEGQGSTVFAGETFASRFDIWYETPGRLRHLSDRTEGPLLEYVLLDDRAWTRSDSGWSEADPANLRSIGLDPLAALQMVLGSGDVSRLGDGPVIGGEVTERFVLVAPNYGQNMIEALESMIAKNPDLTAVLQAQQAAYEGAEAKFEAIVGSDSRRVYVVTMTVTGSAQLQQTIDMSFTYDPSISVEPPVP